MPQGCPDQKTIDLGGGINLQMVLIPAGSFVMGDSSGLDDEQPVHTVTISEPFYLGQTEVTVAQFRQFVEATGYVTDAEKGTGFPSAFGWDSGFNAVQDERDVFVADYRVSAVRRPPGSQRELERRDGILPMVSPRRGTDFPTAHGSGVGVCMPCRVHNTLLTRRRPRGLAKFGNVADAAFEAQFPELEGLINADDGYAYTSPVGELPAELVSACMTCTEASGSGAPTGTTRNTTRSPRATIPWDLQQARNASIVAVAGSTVPGVADPQVAVEANPRTVT